VTVSQSREYFAVFESLDTEPEGRHAAVIHQTGSREEIAMAGCRETGGINEGTRIQAKVRCSGSQHGQTPAHVPLAASHHLNVVQMRQKGTE